jgi:hypothetical protein
MGAPETPQITRGQREVERVSQYDDNTPEQVTGNLVVQPGEIITLSTLAPSAAKN